MTTQATQKRPWEMTDEENYEKYGDTIVVIVEAMLADKAIEVKEGNESYHEWHDSKWSGRDGLEEVLECYYKHHYKYRIKKGA